MAAHSLRPIDGRSMVERSVLLNWALVLAGALLAWLLWPTAP